MTSRRALVRVLLMVAAGWLLTACHQNGTLFAVDVITDSVDAVPGDGLCADAAGDCSLRAAIMEANVLPGTEEVRLTDGLTYTLSIPGTGENLGATGDLDITEALAITGDGTIDAAGLDRVFHVLAASGLVEIDGPNLTGGSAGHGAAVRHEGSGLLSILHSEITDNTPNVLAGSVVSAGGTTVLWLWSSTIHANNHGIATAALHAAAGTIDLQNTTIEAPTGADTLAVRAQGATLGVRHSTVVGTWFGGGTVNSSITTACTDEWLAIFEPLPTSGGHNIETTTSCAFTSTGDQQNTDALLGPIQDNGGDVPTALPAPTSPARDVFGDASCTTFGLDARDLARASNGLCDTGAVELQVGADCAAPGPGAQMQYCDLTSQFLSFQDLTGADLFGADLTNSGPHILTDFTSASFAEATLTNANISGTTIANADFTGTEVTSLRATSVIGTPAIAPSGWTTIGGNLIGPFADITGADFAGHDLSFLTIDNLESDLVDYTGADLGGATLDNGVFQGSDFTDADLKGASTAGATFVGVIWNNTICPDATNSTANGGTCDGHL